VENEPPAVCPGATLVQVMGDKGNTFVSPRLLELALRAGWRPKVNRAFAVQMEGRPACAFEVDADSAENLAWSLVCARTTVEWRCACGITIGKYWPNCVRGLVRKCLSPGLFLVFLATSPGEQPAPIDQVTEMDRAANAIKCSGMDANQREATLEKFRRQEMTLGEVKTMAAQFPPE
jgi:hypothetical protein